MRKAVFGLICCDFFLDPVCFNVTCTEDISLLIYIMPLTENLLVLLLSLYIMIPSKEI